MNAPIPRQRVEIECEISRGSFGTIFKGKLDGFPVAVKEVNNKDSRSVFQTKMREILLELRNLVQIRHPYIVTFWGTALDFPENTSQPAYVGLVFEHCSRGSVHTALFGDGYGVHVQLSIGWKVQIAFQVASGLAYLHSRRIIHRDVNTKNILLTNDMVAKIADFGAARCLPPGSDLLHTTTILGSPAYMAPEQMQGHPLSAKTDSWAFALLLWEMMCQRKPWDGLVDDFEQLKVKTLRGDRLPMPDDRTGWPADYLDLIAAGTNMQPADRPSLEDARQRLQSAAASLPR